MIELRQMVHGPFQADPICHTPSAQQAEFTLADILPIVPQPEMSYERGYCRPECTRCSELCPTGAILKITKEEKTQYPPTTSAPSPSPSPTASCRPT